MLNQDFREFIQSLNDNQVRYLVVGGYAVALHGYPRYTKDMDIWIDLAPDNAARIVRALEQFGFGSLGLQEKDFLEADTIIQLGYPPLRIDLLTTLSGVDFDHCFAAKDVVEMDGILINFIDLENLKKNKRATGLAQLMMQCGMFVGASSFSANLCRGLFTHYRRKEDASIKSGKLDEELERMSKLVEHLSADMMVLFNESFAATNEREGSEIARQITTALLEKRIKVVFVTHQFAFANSFFTRQLDTAIFLRAERRAGGGRTYKLTEGEPLRTSFGEDVYQSVFGGKGWEQKQS